MDDATLQTAIEHTLLDASFERFDAKNAAAKLLPVVKEAISSAVQQQRELDEAERAAANTPPGGGQTRSGMVTTQNAGK